MTLSFDGLGLEAIDFQLGKTFFRELTAICTEARGLKSKAKLAECGVAIRKCIMTHTGINANVDVGNHGYGAGIYSPFYARTHPLNNKDIEKGFRFKLLDVLTPKEGLRGTVDSSSGRVSGSFSELKLNILIGAPLLTKDLITPEEVAAVILHETGHAFTYFEYIGHFYVANQFLAMVALAWQQTNNKEQRITLLKNIEGFYDLKIEGLEVIAEGNNPDTAGTIVISNLYKRLRIQQGSHHYNERSSEMAADQYANRHGAGPTLISALTKLWKVSGYRIYDTKQQMLMANAMHLAHNLVFAGTSAAAGLVLFGTPLVAGAAGALVIVFVLRLTKVFVVNWWGDASNRYDDPADRVKAVKRDLIQVLKDTSIPTEYKKEAVADIGYLNTVVSEINVNDKLYWYAVNSFIYNTVTGRGSALKLQRELETLANNELFVKATQISLHQ